MAFNYLAHGLAVRSELRFDELYAASEGSEPAVEIVVRDGSASPVVPDHVENNSAAFTIPSVARYRIEGGRRIVIERFGEADPRDVRIFALGSAMGLLLHQRGLFALHGAVAVRGGHAIAVTGPSGAGKSTFALRASVLGAELLSDDLAAIVPGEQGATVHRALRRMRLCPDALEAAGSETSEFPLSYRADDDRVKHDVPIKGAIPKRAVLGTVVELAEGGDVRLERLTGADAIDCLMANSFRGGSLANGEQKRRHFANCIDIARSVAVFRLHRPRDSARIDELTETILALGNRY